MIMENNKVAEIFGKIAEITIYLIVAGFFFTESMNFFYFAFPPEQQNIAWLGLGLTGGGMIAYFIMLKTGRADTPLKRVVVLGMIAVCTLGELATAGYGASVEMLKSNGMKVTEDGVKTFVLVIRILGLLHGLAAIAYMGGDEIAAAFSDKNHNGVPDILEKPVEEVVVKQGVGFTKKEATTDFPEPPR
jgi:hypothetical protein